MGLLGDSPELAELKRLLAPVLAANAEFRVKQRAFLTDPFVDGFIVGAAAQYGKTLQNVSERQRVRPLVQLDEMITPSWPGIFGFLQMLVSPHPRKQYEKGNPDWNRGLANGAKMVRWIYNFPGVEQDAEVQAAVQTARPLPAGASQPTRDAVTARLYEILFFDVAAQRFGGSPKRA